MSRKRSKRTGRRLLYFLVALIVLAGVANYARPLPTVAANPTALSSDLGTVALKWPSDGASAAIGAVGYGVLSTQSNLQLPTASIAKLITALTVLKIKPLSVGEQGPSITITAQDVAIYESYVSQDGSVIPVTKGETLSEYQALQAMLLPSANNIADALAIWAYGSLTTYSAAANKEVQSLGLNHTAVGNDASGLSPTTTSSPSNLVVLGSVALENPVIAQIVDEPTATLPIAGTVQNVNFLLGQFGINGIKTGNSDQAGGCYLFSAPYSLGGQSVTIVGAIMHAPSLEDALADAIPLLDSAKQGFALEKPISAGQHLGIYTTAWGETVTAVARGDISLLAWQGVTLVPHLDLHTLSHTQLAGTSVGTVSVSSGTYHSSTPLILQQSFSSPTFWWRLTRH